MPQSVKIMVCLVPSPKISTLTILGSFLEGRDFAFVIAYADDLTVRAKTGGHLVFMKPEWFLGVDHDGRMYAIAHELAHV